MAGPVGKLGWRLIGIGLGMPATIVTRRAIEATWRATRGTEPPKNAGAVDANWLEAIAWAAASSMAFATSRVIATRAAASTYRTLTGREPPGLDLDRAD
ncbi:MAG: DUF4235 domain-containing protein [Mycobacteriales bacterium]